MADRLVVRGAREHNLRGVDLDIPRDSLVVFTGLSGSGKSSLAFDTIFAEGQRRYVESLSAYARQFLGQMDKPDVDFIEGLSPAVSIDQKSTNRNPRSTVGTITEVYDYLRLLYARAGVPHCPVCGHVIEKQTPQQIVDQVLAMEEGTRFQVLAPVVRTRKGEFVDLFANLQGQGYSRVLVDGTVHPLTDPPKLKKQEKHDIAVVVDRLTVKAEREAAAHRLGGDGAAARRRPGRARVRRPARRPTTHRERRFSERMACPNGHPLTLDDLEPRTFSFNSPYGACPECTGLGIQKEVDPELVVPDVELSLAEGAIAPWAVGQLGGVLRPAAGGPGQRHGLPHVHAVAAAAVGCAEGRAARQRRPGPRPLPQPLRPRALLLRQLRGRHPVPGAAARPDRVRAQRERYEGYMRDVPCPVCKGARLKPEVLAVTLLHRDQGERSIAEVSAMSVAECSEFLAGMELDARQTDDRGRDPQGGAGPAGVPARRGAGLPVAVPRRRVALRAARRSASGWPPRSAPAWSACSTCSTSRPSACTSATTAGCIETLVRLRDLGNTLIVVEHDEDTIRASDWVVDIGPGAGEHGGKIVHSGTVRGAARRTRSRSPAPTCPGGGRSRCPTSAGRSTASGS